MITPEEIIAFFAEHDIVARPMCTENLDEVVVPRIPLKALCEFINEKFPVVA